MGPFECRSIAGGVRRSAPRVAALVRAVEVAALAVAMIGAAPGSASGQKSQGSAPPTRLQFTGDRAEAERFIAYDKSIELTAEQEAIRKEALEALPAPCCAKFSAATCCCKCNLAKATWGLAKHLIVDGAGVSEVRQAVADWHRAINPGGFTGDACFTGGCARPFAQNGCGGMKESELVF